MGNYNFSNNDAELGQTKLLGTLPDEVKKLEAKQTNAPLELRDATNGENLDDADEYLSDEDIALLKKRNRRFMKIVFLTAICIGLMVCAIGFVLMTTFLDKGQIQPEAAESAMVEDRLVLVKDITSKNELVILDWATGEDYTVKTGTNTHITDSLGNNMLFNDIVPGDVLQMSVLTTSQMAKKISTANNAWVMEDVTGLVVNSAEKSIIQDTAGTSVENAFKYTDDTLFIYDKRDIRPEDIFPVDIVTLKGVGNTVLSASVTGYHGYVSVNNSNNIKNGNIKIGNTKPLPLNKATRIPIATGVHELLISGDNIENRHETVFIIAQEETSVDLAAAQSKTGVLIVKANVQDYNLFINDTQASPNMPIVLPQGECYNVLVEKQGYKPWSTELDLNEPSITLTAELKALPAMGILTINTSPPGGTISIDGSYLGQAPISHQMQNATYEVTVHLNGYEDYTGTITLSGASSLVTIPLTPLSEDTQTRRTNNEPEQEAAREYQAPTPVRQ